MPDQQNITKAVLQKISWDKDGNVINPEHPGPEFEVQFNPETLTVAFSNQVAGGDQAGGSAIQFNSKGTTKLTFDLFFDVTDPKLAQRFNKDNKPEFRNDVRRITKLVADFMQTEKKGSGKKAKFIPPGIRFKWGTFTFDGVVDSINEKIDFFSEEGVPLRATLGVGITKQDVDIDFIGGDVDAQGEPFAGTSAKPASKQGGNMADELTKNGNSGPWQGDAMANGIENPRNLPLGQPLELGTDLAAQLNASLQVKAGVGFGASASLGGSIGGSFGGGISASLDSGGGLDIGGGLGGGIGGGIDIGADSGFGIDASSALALNGGADLDLDIDGNINVGGNFNF